MQAMIVRSPLPFGVFSRHDEDALAWVIGDGEELGL